MRAGLLDERATFQRVTETQDAAGEPDETWNDLASRWASFGAVSARELIESQQTRAEVDYTVVVRHDSVTTTLKPKDRMKIGSRVFGLVHVLNQGKRGGEVELLVKEVV